MQENNVFTKIFAKCLSLHDTIKHYNLKMYITSTKWNKKIHINDKTPLNIMLHFAVYNHI